VILSRIHEAGSRHPIDLGGKRPRQEFVMGGSGSGKKLLSSERTVGAVARTSQPEIMEVGEGEEGVVVLPFTSTDRWYWRDWYETAAAASRSFFSVL
jgi:hypothetical protein